jgi:hypothetical protein
MEQPRPKFDVFLSHSSQHKHWADAACSVLEKHGIRCWVAPRDIMPSEEWGEAIIRGINSSRMMVVVFSGNANNSRMVRNEVERAMSRSLPMLPLRIENIAPTGALEFHLSSTHWLDAFPPPVEGKLEELAQTVKAILGMNGSARTKPKTSKTPVPPPRPKVTPRVVKPAPVMTDSSWTAPKPPRKPLLEAVAGAAVALLVIGLLVVVAVLLTWKPGPKEVAKLKLGMTLKEMLGILGEGQPALEGIHNYMGSALYELQPSTERAWQKAIGEDKVYVWDQEHGVILAAFPGHPSSDSKVDVLLANHEQKPADKWTLSQENFLKLKVGMSLKELEDIIGAGEPTRQVPSSIRNSERGMAGIREYRVYQWYPDRADYHSGPVILAGFSAPPPMPAPTRWWPSRTETESRIWTRAPYPTRRNKCN